MEEVKIIRTGVTGPGKYCIKIQTPPKGNEHGGIGWAVLERFESIDAMNTRFNDLINSNEYKEG